MKKNIQPYIIAIKGQKCYTYFIQADGQLLSPPSNDAAAVFDSLFKLFYITNTSYPNQLQNFYEFIQHYVYGLDSEIHSVVRSLHVNLCNVSLS